MTMKRQRRAFTLLELLVVIGIMGLLGAITTGGYRSMVRGMEERGALQEANAFVRAAYERAQTDRQPTAVYFWNELLRSEDAKAGHSLVVVGRAVAVRRQGRFTRVENGSGKGAFLVDEFADLDQVFATPTADEESKGGASDQSTMSLWNMDDIASGKLYRSRVSTTVFKNFDRKAFFLGETVEGNAGTGGEIGGGIGGGDDDGGDDDDLSKGIPGWAFVLQDAGDAPWTRGSAYGFEFQTMTLPRNYIFGDDYPTSEGTPTKSAGVIVFKAAQISATGEASGGILNGGGTVKVRALRQKGGSMQKFDIGTTVSPDKGI